MDEAQERVRESSLHDSMNLVSKEYLAAKTDVAGILVLSRFTGAAPEMADAARTLPKNLPKVYGLPLKCPRKSVRSARECCGHK
jgi:trehalose-6-phosphate synthase